VVHFVPEDRTYMTYMYVLYVHVEVERYCMRYELGDGSFNRDFHRDFSMWVAGEKVYWGVRTWIARSTIKYLILLSFLFFLYYMLTGQRS
jgi:hypothetical protein